MPDRSDLVVAGGSTGASGTPSPAGARGAPPPAGSSVRSPAEPPIDPGTPATATQSGLGAILAPAILAVLGVAAAVAVTVTDLRAPTPTDWHIVGVLAAVGAIGILVGYRFNPPDDDSAPPWDVDTVWLLPAALLGPPAAVGPLVALSLIAGLIKVAHPFRWRIVVASITLLTTAAVLAAARLIDGFALGALVGIAALWIIGAIAALIVAHVIGTPSGTVLWLDDRWTLVELGCAFSGLLIAAAMRSDPWLGFAALAPLLLAAFALRWPELTWHARIDPKTGLPNAWDWEERTRDLLRAAEVRRLPVSVMIIDIDRFKVVNDTYGHLAGDAVLNEVADVLRSQLRQGDLVGRFGGEEFVVTMFGLTPAAAVAAAERTRIRIGALHHRVARVPPGSAPPQDGAVPRTRDRSADVLRGLAAPNPNPHAAPDPIPDAGGTASGAGGPVDTCTITCTIGVASSSTHGYELTRLLDLADMALAAGKTEGRNRVREAAAVLAEVGADGSVTHGNAGPRSLWHVAVRRRPDRRTRRHGPGSMFR